MTGSSFDGAGGPRERVVMIGLDAFDPTLTRRWAASGDLPVLGRLFREAASCEVANPYGLFVGALWVNFASALRPDRHGFHCWQEIAPGGYGFRDCPPMPERFDSFWKRIGDAGRRVAAVDVPHSRAPASLHGVELCEWGCHDRHYGLHSQPPALAGQVAAAHGLHPVLGIHPIGERHFAPDDHVFRRGLHRTAAEEKALVAATTAGAVRKGRLVRELLAAEPWDFFLAVFGEAHAIGHQLWHLHDPAHPRFDMAARARLGGDPLLDVYRAIDAALGALLEELGPETLLLVHCSHGMTAHHDGDHLLEELLRRLDAARPGAAPRRARFSTAAVRRVRRLVERARLPGPLRRLAARPAQRDSARVRAAQAFFKAPNNSVIGGIRLNLVGREPDGVIRPDEVERVCAGLEEDLLALVNEATGRPAVLKVTRADSFYARTPGDTLPDLFVEWDRSAPVETLSSPRTGRFHIPYTMWRTGDHLPGGLLLARGAGFGAGEVLPPVAVEDLGPSIAARLGVTLADVDGRVQPALADPEAAPVPLPIALSH
ncbi:MAG TPA: alkaline phosphatase family protein [Allosphingosinicella sp.]|nr:alkaline phosphatase family protein [Allosphingosinicella sp.]